MLDTGQLPLSGEALDWFRQGLAAVTAEQYEQAVAAFNRVLEARPDFYEAWYERGLALEHWGYYAEAILSFDRALDLSPRKEAASDIWHDRGNALQYGLGRYLDAMACYDRALRLNPDHSLGWHNRGNAFLYGLSRPEDAIACYDQSLQLNPAHALTWRNRGHALVELRRYLEAVASYDRAIAINPDDEISWQAQALASERSGLLHKLPTTNPAWYDTGAPTFIEGETDAKVTFASDFSSTSEFDLLPLGHPVLVIEDDWGRREILLERDRYLIGRDASNDIQLYSRFVSRHHAVLTRISSDDVSGYQLVDGNLAGKPSTNGLLINGRKRQSRQLKPDDTIVFGPGVQATYRIASIQPLPE
jgi:tetratricopeptide (TPR) repeat protein